jgi:hypothetical protein
MTNALDSSQVRIAGTGAIWKAPLGSVLPTDSIMAWDAAFKNLGYAEDGFIMTPTLTTKGVNAWQSLENLRNIATALTRKFGFNLKQTNKDTLAMAWGGGVITPNPPTLGSVTIVASTGVLTVSAVHGLSVNDPVKLGAITGTTGITAGVTYYVKTVPTTTTLTLSATVGGAALALTTDGSAVSIAKITGAYSLVIPGPSDLVDFILGIDWSDGATNQRIIIQRASPLALPVITGGRQKEIDYIFEVESLAPADGTKSILIYGVDVAVGS